MVHDPGPLQSQACAWNLLHRPGWPLSHRDPIRIQQSLPPRVLGLKAYTTTLSNTKISFKKFYHNMPLHTEGAGQQACKGQRGARSRFSPSMCVLGVQLWSSGLAASNCSPELSYQPTIKKSLKVMNIECWPRIYRSVNRREWQGITWAALCLVTASLHSDFRMFKLASRRRKRVFHKHKAQSRTPRH